MRAIVLVALLVVGYLLYKLYFRKFLQQGKTGQIKLAVIALGLVFLALALTGRAPALFALVGAAMTQIMRFAPLLIRFAPSLRRYLGGAGLGAAGAAGAGGFGKAGGDGGGQQSRVRTPTLEMTLDHATGAIDGQVLTGPFANRTLNALSVAELRQLYQQCETSDPDALRLLQAYIARARAEDWEEPPASENAAPPTGSAAMSISEAYEVLALTPEATRDDIVRAHRSLMGKLHPDKGGSTYLATKVNAAREILLDSLRS